MIAHLITNQIDFVCVLQYDTVTCKGTIYTDTIDHCCEALGFIDQLNDYNYNIWYCKVVLDYCLCRHCCDGSIKLAAENYVCNYMAKVNMHKLSITVLKFFCCGVII